MAYVANYPAFTKGDGLSIWYDARQTLLDPGGPIDVVLLDGGSGMYTEIVQILQPSLREGAVVIADNVGPGDEEG